jgi:hypothetical protein
MVKIQIEILGEILQVRDRSSGATAQLYPGQVYRTQDVPLSYDELRGMGNGTHLLKAKKAAPPTEE